MTVALTPRRRPAPPPPRRSPPASGPSSRGASSKRPDPAPAPRRSLREIGGGYGVEMRWPLFRIFLHFGACDSPMFRLWCSAEEEQTHADHHQHPTVPSRSGDVRLRLALLAQLRLEAPARIRPSPRWEACKLAL